MEKFCENCGGQILVIIFQDSGFCSVDCQKAKKGPEEDHFMAMLTRKELKRLRKQREKAGRS